MIDIEYAGREFYIPENKKKRKKKYIKCCIVFFVVFYFYFTQHVLSVFLYRTNISLRDKSIGTVNIKLYVYFTLYIRAFLLSTFLTNFSDEKLLTFDE